MKSSKIQIGGYVRIVKDGSYEGEYPKAEYNIGELWKVIRGIGAKVYDVERNGIMTRVSTNPDDSSYGEEAVWHGMNPDSESEVIINNSYEIY